MQNPDHPRRVDVMHAAAISCCGMNTGIIARDVRGGCTLIGKQDIHNHKGPSPKRDPIAWLSPLDYSAQQRECKSRTAPNTGQWLLSSAKFVDWSSKQCQKLWCVGMPGAGKTILASIVINHLEETKLKSSSLQPAIAYLYLTYKDQPSLEHLLGSVAKQLLDRSKDPPQSLISFWEHQHHPSLTELHEILVDVTQDRQVYIIVDALDEYTPSLRNELLDHLRKIREDINLLVTSRVLEDLETMSKGFERLDVTAQSQDIHEYIDYVIEEHGRLRHMVTEYPELRENIKDRVTKKSSQMFLLAKLHMDAIAAQVSAYSVRKKLAELPESPEGTYSSAMKRIQDQKQEKRECAIQILSWITCAYRPLSVEELLHALAVEKGDEYIYKDKMLLKKDLEEFCCGLVVIDSETATVRLVHHTAQNYFALRKEEEFPDFHRRMASVCGTYLCMQCLEEPDEVLDKARNEISPVENLHEALETSLNEPQFVSQHQARDKSRCGLPVPHNREFQGPEPPGSLSFEMKLKYFPFVKYAGMYLGRHFRDLPGHSANEDIIETLRPLLEKRPKRNFYQRLLTHLRTYHFRSQYYWYKEGDLDSYAEMCGVSYANVSGESTLTARFWRTVHIPSSTAANTEPSQTLSAFHRGNRTNLSDSTAEDSSSSNVRQLHSKRSSLHLAVFLGTTSLVRSFIEAGVDIDALDDYGQSALVLAVKGDYPEIITILLRRGATIDLSTDEGHSLLLHAAQKNAMDTVQGIIAGILRHCNGCWPIIAKAASCLVCTPTASKTRDDGEKDFMPKPLRRSKSALGNLQRDELLNYTKLLSAAYDGNLATMTKLINSSNMVLQFQSESRLGKIQETQARFVKTACFFAVERGHVQVTSKLLEYLQDPNIQDYQGRTLLHRAVSQNSMKMAELLLRRMVSPNMQDNHGLTAWTANARPQRAKILLLLKDFGANPNIQDADGVNILCRAAAGGHVKDVDFLLKQGVNPSVRTNCGWTPLHWAAHNDRQKCVRLLLKWGAALSPISDQGTTPLDLAKSHRRESIIRVLEAFGAETGESIYARRRGDKLSHSPEDRPIFQRRMTF